MDERIEKYFDHLNYNFTDVTYPKNTLIISPVDVNHKIIFVLEGTIQLYGINEAGGIYPVHESSGFSMLGDMEFSGCDFTPFYVEAKTEVRAVYLDMDTEREQLSKDVTFLNHVIVQLAEKVELYNRLTTFNPTVEEKIKTYFRFYSKINGIESLCARLHCGKRQCLRVIKKLCEEGFLQKEKKGVYVLKDDHYIRTKI